MPATPVSAAAAAYTLSRARWLLPRRSDMPCALPSRVSADTASGLYMAGLRNAPRQCSTALSSRTEAASDPAALFNGRGVGALELQAQPGPRLWDRRDQGER